MKGVGGGVGERMGKKGEWVGEWVGEIWSLCERMGARVAKIKRLGKVRMG